MSMDQSFVEAVRDVIVTPQTENGMVVVPPGWKELRPHQASVPSLIVHTLGSVIGYIKDWVEDGPPGMPLLVHVVNPTMVHVLGALGPEARDYVRPVYLQAGAPPCAFQFGAWLDTETAIIGLMTQFTDTPERTDLLTLLASIRENAVRETTDDGVAQEVTTRQGVVLANRARVMSPVQLAPYRTFRELPQPVSPFIVRLRAAPSGERPHIALFEADSATWRLAAVSAIRTYLAVSLVGLDRVVVIA